MLEMFVDVWPSSFKVFFLDSAQLSVVFSK